MPYPFSDEFDVIFLCAEIMAQLNTKQGPAAEE
jgi:hypothetical protein